MRRYPRRNRNALESNVLAHVLPFVAGTVNASGFGACRALILVASFFLGALLAAALAERARQTDKSPYSGTLEFEALALAVITGLGLTEPKGIP